MGIQINGQTDIISATDGSLTISGADLPTVTNLNATGIVTATSFSGPLTGNVTGNLTGNVTGNVTGNATGLSGSPTLSGITSVSTTNLTVNGNAYPSDGVVSGARNRIINGDMRIDQRNAGASVTPPDSSATYIVDRFRFIKASTNSPTLQQVTDAPTGFSNSLKFTNSNDSVTPTYAQVAQCIEGFNIADFGFGTSSAKTVSLSFWVKSSVVGSYSVALRNSASDRVYVSTYSVANAGTWEYKTISIAGDTTGTWLTNNGVGIELIFRFGGTGGTSTLNAWQSSGEAFASGAVNIMSTANSTWQITGVQLEVGTVATPFERRSYGQELDLCRRYYFKGSLRTGATLYGSTPIGYFMFLNEMRTNPATVGYISGSGYTYLSGVGQVNYIGTAFNSIGTSVESAQVGLTGSWSGGTPNTASCINLLITCTLSAEL